MTSGGGSLAQVLKSQGPIVSCVLLRYEEADGCNEKQQGTPQAQKADETTSSPCLQHLVEEIQIDTTPNQNGVQTILGGPFTFIGQYPSEGVVVMGRSDQPQDDLDADALQTCEVSELRYLGEQLIPSFDANAYESKDELVKALCRAQLPVNPHTLQPPLHKCTVRGSILLMRVGGETEEESEDEETEDLAMAISKAMADLKQAAAVSNQDFFLNYSKQEYVAFASRTDIVAAEEESEDEEEEGDGEDEEEEEDDDEDDDEDDESDGDFNPLEDGMLQTKEEKNAMMHLIMGEVLIEFREVNKRGPTTEELLDLRQQVAAKLNIVLPEPPSPGPGVKRTASQHATDGTTAKRVKFDPAVVEQPQDDDDDDAKPKAKLDESSKENDGKPSIDQTNASASPTKTNQASNTPEKMPAAEPPKA